MMCWRRCTGIRGEGADSVFMVDLGRYDKECPRMMIDRDGFFYPGKR